MKKIIFLVILFNLVLLVSQLWLTTQRAADGAKLAQLEEELSQLKLHSLRLAGTVYTHASLATVASKAQAAQLGSVKTEIWTAAPMAAAR